MKEVKNGFVLIICVLISILNSYSQDNNLKGLQDNVFVDNARKYTAEFFKKNFEDLYNKFSIEMKNEVSISYLNDFHAQFIRDFGNEIKILSERLDTISTNYTYYDRTSSFDKYDAPIYIRWILDKQMVIHGFFINTIPRETDSKYLDYKTKSELQLPFEGEWFVFWGGRMKEDNNHTSDVSQRFAYDFVQTKDGKTHISDGKKNEDYYCYDKLIVVPCAGRIISIENQIDDNTPGEMNPYLAAGNYVIIDHGNGEFSFMAHLKKGSIIAKKGDLILKGQEIGRCGNSGNSSEPHLHYHLQNDSIWFGGEGLPSQFRNYIANGDKVTNGEPHNGQIIKNDKE